MFSYERSKTIMAFSLFKRISPEYVLEKVFADIKASGAEGLKPYLTASAKKKFDTLQVLSDGVGMFTGGSGNALNFLLAKLSEFEWTIKDVLKGSESAKGVVGFKYEDIMEGTVELSMIKEDKEWKIDNLDMPKFDKFTLPQNEKKAD